MAERFAAEYAIERSQADATAAQLGMPIRHEYPDGRVIEIQGLDERGIPYYYTTHNAVSAQTIGVDRVQPGGADGRMLTGVGETLGVWDSGAVRSTHRELEGRVTQVDDASGISGHATLVSGTMIASGIRAEARGMSYEASLRAYDWNNALSEMSSAAAGGLTVSNHSYGLVAGWGGTQECGGAERRTWHGNTSISESEDHRFGFYNTAAQNVDDLARSAPLYLIVQSAGNDRGDSGPGAGEPHCIRSGSGWEVSTVSRPPDGGSSGYDSVSGRAVAKNNLTIGAVQDIPGGYAQPGDVNVTGFSAWGPTDDGRIKPDLVANGAGLLSSAGGGDAAYNSASGTSLSAPSAAGAVGLLLQHHRALNGDTPLRASTIKALLIQTADEAGTANGPDYSHGWGLINLSRAAALMQLDADLGGGVLQEHFLEDGSAIEVPLDVTAGDPALRVTIAWTDVPGTPTAPSLDPTIRMLVNDLDLEVIGPDGRHLPWTLDPANPAAAATTGDNTLDNVEQIAVYDPVPGDYTVRISHKGTLSGGPQPVSLVLDRGTGPTYAISGRVVLESDPTTGAGAVDVNVAGIVQDSTTTDAEGYFRFEGLYEGDYVVTPSLDGISFTPESRTVTLAGSDLEGIDFSAATSGRRLVTMELNTASIPDTLTAAAEVRIRGCLDDCAQASYELPDGQTLATDPSSSIQMTHAGGDYWEAVFEVPEQTAVHYTFAVATGDEPEYTLEASEDHAIQPGIGPLLPPLHFFEFDEDLPYDWRPWEPQEGSIAIQFRGYLAADHNPIIAAVRGNDLGGEGPLRWDQPRLTLWPESEEANSAGERLYSGVAFYPEALAGEVQTYRFRLEVLNWTSSEEYTFIVPESDTTLHWVALTNGQPRPTDDEAALDEDEQITIDVLENDDDLDGDSLFVASAASGAHGTTTLEEDGRITYVPDADFHGSDTFTYTLEDARGARAEGTVTATVRPVNDPPIAGTISEPSDGDTIHVTGDPDEILLIRWTSGDDVDQDDLSYAWELASDESFAESTVLVRVEAGASTDLEIEYGALAQQLTDAGYDLGGMAGLHHRVAVSDGTVEVAGAMRLIHLVRGTITSVGAPEHMPERVTLDGNYPNPFNPSTTIRFGLPKAADVRLEVYDALGRRVRVLVDGMQPAGWHDVRFEAARLPSGVYFYTLHAGSKARSGRMILLQ